MSNHIKNLNDLVEDCYRELDVLGQEADAVIAKNDLQWLNNIERLIITQETHLSYYENELNYFIN